MEKQQYKVRLAKPTDLDSIMVLQKELFDKLGMSYLGRYVPEDARESVVKLLGSKEVVTIVGELNGKVIACLGIKIVPQPFNKAVLVATEITWYCRKGHKGFPEYILEEANKMLKSRGVKGFFTYAKETNKVLQRYYRIKQYRPIETCYYKEL